MVGTTPVDAEGMSVGRAEEIDMSEGEESAGSVVGIETLTGLIDKGRRRRIYLTSFLAQPSVQTQLMISEIHGGV